MGVRAKLIKPDPTAGVTDLPLPKNDGHLPWSDDDLAAYEARWPIGTRQRVWFDVLAYTGHVVVTPCALVASTFGTNCDHQDGEDRRGRHAADLSHTC